MEQTIVEAHNCQTKKPNSKTPYTTSTDQHKSTKKRVSTKPKLDNNLISKGYEVLWDAMKKQNDNINVQKEKQ